MVAEKIALKGAARTAADMFSKFVYAISKEGKFACVMEAKKPDTRSEVS